MATCSIVQGCSHQGSSRALIRHCPSVAPLFSPLFQAPFHHSIDHCVQTNTRIHRCRIFGGQPKRGVMLQAAPTPHETTNLANLAVFVSGGGSNFRAIHAAILEGRIAANVSVVVSNNPTCGGCEYARQHGIAVEVYPASRKHPDAFSPADLVDSLQHKYSVQYIVLAGYLKLIPSELVRAYPRRMLNIHPGLLPSFGGAGMYGQRVHTAVIASGARFSGPTVHFVDEEYDTGAILAQRVVPVMPDDTPERLATRVLQQEHQVYPEVVAALVEGRVAWREDGVPYMMVAR